MDGVDIQKIPGVAFIHSNEKEETYDYTGTCPKCNAIIFKGKYCSNCGVQTVWVINRKLKKDDFSDDLKDHI